MSRPERLLRFGATERLYHWAQGLPFLALLATGGLLLAGRLRGRPLVDPGLLVLLHQVSAATLGAAILLVFVGGDRRTLLANAARALRWGRDDLVWLIAFPLAGLVVRLRIPPSGKFNPGQKINLLAQFVLLPTFAASGLVMWFVPGALLAWYVHVASFAIAGPLVAGHLYLALLHPATRKGLPGIFTGRVDARWAREHYELEYGPDREER